MGGKISNFSSHYKTTYTDKLTLALDKRICYTVASRVFRPENRTAAISILQDTQGVIQMRAVDDSSPKYAAILCILQTWKQLPESDVTRMVRDYYLVTDDYREMEDQGLLTMAFVGDEYMLTPTTLGRIWLEQYTEEKKS